MTVYLTLSKTIKGLDDKCERITLFNTRGSRLAFFNEEHAKYFLEVEHPEILEKYPYYRVNPYYTGDDELNYKWDKEV